MRLLPLLLLAACPRSDDDPCLPSATGSDEPTLMIGGGSDRFEELASGADREIVQGAQGGHHMELGLAGTWLPGSTRPKPVYYQGRMTGTLDGTVISDVDEVFLFRCNNAEHRQESWANLLILEMPPEEADGHDIAIHVELEVPEGPPLTADTILHAVYGGSP